MSFPRDFFSSWISPRISHSEINGLLFPNGNNYLKKKKKCSVQNPNDTPQFQSPFPMSDPSFPLHTHHADSSLDRFTLVDISEYEVQVSSSEQ